MKLTEFLEIKKQEAEEILKDERVETALKLYFQTKANTYIEIQSFINQSKTIKYKKPDLTPYQKQIIGRMKAGCFFIQYLNDAYKTPVFRYESVLGVSEVERFDFPPPTKTIINNWIKKGILEIENHEGIERIVLTEKYRA